MSDINIGALSEAINDKMDRDLNNRINNSGLRKLVESYINGTSWYKIFDEIQSDGTVKKWCEQGGSVNATSGAWVFLKPFADTNYIVQMSIYRTSSSSAGWNAHSLYNTKTTTEIGYQNADSSLCMLYACGYIS